jgi:hypothetical protein
MAPCPPSRRGLRLAANLENKVASAAAILSLALAIGACLSAFRLIDALLLRPLPIAAPQRLYAVSFEGVLERPGAGKGAPLFGAAKRTFDGEDRSKRIT